MDRGDHPGVKIHAVKPLKYKRLSINFCPEHHWRKMETAYYLGFVEKRDLTLQRIEAQYRWNYQHDAIAGTEGNGGLRVNHTKAVYGNPPESGVLADGSRKGFGTVAAITSKMGKAHAKPVRIYVNPKRYSNTTT